MAGYGAFPDAAGTRFRVHATRTKRVNVLVLDARGEVVARHPMRRAKSTFEAHVAGVKVGARYLFELDGRRVRDPFARFLPDGVFGPAIVTEAKYPFRYARPEVPIRDRVIYELHIGTFTIEGTYRAAEAHLPSLVDLGITTIDLLPVAAFPGARGWGYDGVAHFAPYAPYGPPDDLCHFVDEAHRLGLGVLLDVVYNHFGPSGNVLAEFDRDYFTSKHHTPWGSAPNYDNPAMRAYAIENALHWLVDYRFDGLRLDATHDIHDASHPHLLAEMAAEIHEKAPGAWLIAEDFRNHPTHNLDLGLDGVWVNDFHHQLHVTLTHERRGEYRRYEPGVAALRRVIDDLWLHGGRIAELPSSSAIYYLQNHDQVGNRARGDRLTATIGIERCRAAAMLVLFLPTIPLIFMGEEWAASTPFAYFTDHDAELGKKVTAGRRRDYELAKGEALDPQAEATFTASRLDHGERERGEHARTLAYYRALLDFRKRDEVLRNTGRNEMWTLVRGDVLVVIRGHGKRRVLGYNLGATAVTIASLDLGVGLRPLLWSTAPKREDRLAAGAAVILGEG